jgi:CelD/BcsL family acetyltransferase involved in cellulose biosynthesis
VAPALEIVPSSVRLDGGRADDGRDTATRAPIMWVRAVRRLDELAEHVPAWEALAAAALEPNPFHEPWMLVPALRAFAAGRDVRVVLVFAEGERDGDGQPILCGVFPLVRVSRYKGLPVSALALWTHDYAPLGTPLVRATHTRACLTAFLCWLGGSEAGALLLELGGVTADGAFHRALVRQLRAQARPSFLDERAARACFRPRESAEAYLAAACSGIHLKEMRRLRRRLADGGRLTLEALPRGGDVEGWLREFLALEASGWKGRSGTALDCRTADREFLLAVGLAAHHRERLDLLALRLDGRPVAMKLNVRAAPGAFALKIAFDEAFARFSPGVLLELDNIRRLHEAPDVAWMDSCAVPGHPMIDRLWPDRRAIETLVISAQRVPGDLLVSALPALRRLHRLRRRLAPWLSRARPGWTAR